MRSRLPNLRSVHRKPRNLLPLAAAACRWVAIPVALAAINGCKTLDPIEPPDPHVPAAGAATATGAPESYRMTAGDTVDIDVYRRSDLQSVLSLKAVEVNGSGAVHMPVAGSVPVQGLTVEEASRKVASALGASMVEPAVSFNVVSAHGRRFYVLGEVLKPGVYDARPNITLLEAVLMAGGFTQSAEADSIFVVRKDPDRKVGGDLEELLKTAQFQQNIAIQPLDVVYVPPSGIAQTERFLAHVTNILQPFIDISSVVVLSRAISN